MRSKAEITTILDQVRARLAQYAKRTGPGLHVPPDGYLAAEDWRSVLLEPNESGLRASADVDALDDIEGEVRKAGMKGVLLVPGFGG